MGATAPLTTRDRTMAATLAFLAVAVVVIAPSAGAVGAATVTLATFDNAPGTTFKWLCLDGPTRMGPPPSSVSTFKIDGSMGHFNGTVADDGFPGFCKIETETLSTNPPFNDASKFIGGALYLEVETTTATYTGFKVAFGAKNATNPYGRPVPRGFNKTDTPFKAGFNVTGTARTTVKIPFNSFSIDYTYDTGRCDAVDPDGAHHVCCSSKHPEVCPTAQHLSQITSLLITAEGVDGNFDLRVLSIGAGPLTTGLLVV